MFDQFNKSRIFGATDPSDIERYNRNLDAIQADIDAIEQLRASMPHKSAVLDKVIAALRHEYQIVFRKWDT